MEQKRNIPLRHQEENHYTKIITPNLTVKRLSLDKQKEFKSKLKLSNDNYIFLGDLPLILQWASKTKNIKKSDLMLLLYIQVKIVFRYSEFKLIQKHLGRTSDATWSRLRADGWIGFYSRHKKFKHYCLSNKACHLITKIYKLILLEDTFPLDYQHNSFISRDVSKQDNEILEVLLEFNRRVRNKV